MSLFFISWSPFSHSPPLFLSPLSLHHHSLLPSGVTARWLQVVREEGRKGCREGWIEGGIGGRRRGCCHLFQCSYHHSANQHPHTYCHYGTLLRHKVNYRICWPTLILSTVTLWGVSQVKIEKSDSTYFEKNDIDCVSNSIKRVLKSFLTESLTQKQRSGHE